ncbi:MAG TPA: site-specific tyrosine recombinase XerD, partial [Caldithrix abyssi]|nr:site-specific tyrosine recombinase XerD [Caldithrix abyssi]
MNKKVRDFLRYLYLERRFTRNTITSYGTDLVQFQRFLENHLGTSQINWSLVDKRTIRYFLINLQEQNVSKRTVARKLATLKSFFRYLVKNEILESNPVSSIKMPKLEKKLPEYLSVSETEKLLSLPDFKTFEGLRDLAILELFYGTG